MNMPPWLAWMFFITGIVGLWFLGRALLFRKG
jgi:hypothetical protein